MAEAWGQSDLAKTQAAARGVKVMLRVYQRRASKCDCEPATDGATPGCWKGQLDMMFLQIIAETTNMAQVCTANQAYELRKILVHVILVYSQGDRQRQLLHRYWLEDPSRAQEFCHMLVNIIGEAPVNQETEENQVLAWKAKARIMRTWSFLAHQIAVPVPSQEPAVEQASNAIVQMMIHCDTALMEACITCLDFDLPGLDDMRDSAVWAAFEMCAVDMMECMSTTHTVFRESRQALFVGQADALLSRVLYRYLQVNGLDTVQFDEDAEEYANRNADDFRKSLSCAHGCPRLIDCDICLQQMDEDDGMMFLAADGPSTARSAAICVMREVIKLSNRQAEGPFLQFINMQLSVDPTGDEAAQLNILATRGAALRSLAAVVDRAGASILSTNDGSMDFLQAVVENVLIPETSTNIEFPFAAHLRCIACTVLDRFVGFLSRSYQYDLMGKSIHSIMNCLCDPSHAVRVHALNALKDLVESRCCGPDGCQNCTCLRDKLQVIAADMMNWLAALLDDPTQPGTPQVMMVLMAFLQTFEQTLGDVGPQDARHGDVAFRQKSVLHAHANLFGKLLQRLTQLSQAYRDTLARERRADADLSREICHCIEVMQALMLSAPKNGGTVFDEFCPSLEAYAHEALGADVLTALVKNKYEAEATDLLSLIPLEQREIWGRIIQRIYATLEEAPVHSELLIQSIIEYLHFDGSRHLYLEDGMGKITQLATACMHSGLPLIQCRAAELLRSAIIMGACEDTTAVRPVICSTFMLPQTLHADTTAHRRGLMTLMLQCMSASLGDASQNTNRVSQQVPARFMSAICAAIYVDPQGCVPQLQETYDDSGKTGFQVFVEFWASNSSGRLDRSRTVDMQLSVLAITCVLHIYNQQGVTLDQMRPLFNAGTMMASKFRLELASILCYMPDLGFCYTTLCGNIVVGIVYWPSNPRVTMIFI